MKLTYRPLSIAASILLGTAAAVAAEDWDQFRGPRGDGVAFDCGPPLTWSAESNVRWSADVPGKGWSCPIVVGREVWLTTATEDGRSLSALAFDLGSGRETFNRVLFKVARPREIHTFNSYASPTPAADAERIYLSWGSYGLATIDRASREVVWSRRDLPCHHWRGPGSSPVPLTAADGSPRLVLPYDGYDHQYVVCFDGRTGRTVWRVDRPADFGSDDGDKRKAYATPLVFSSEDGVTAPQAVCPTSFGVFSYALDDGRELWRAETGQFSPACRPVLTRVDGSPRLLVTTGFGRGAVMAIDPRADAADRVRWTQSKTMPSKPSPVAHEDRVYCVSDKGVLSVLDIRTGDVTGQLRLGGNFSASPVLVGGSDGPVLIAADESGRTLVVSTGDQPAVLAENSLPTGMLASPVPTGDGLLLRTRDRLWLIAADDDRPPRK